MLLSRIINILKKYRLSFSLEGLIAFILMMAPNLFWAVFTPENDLLSKVSFDNLLIEKFSLSVQSLMIAMIIMVKNSTKTDKNSNKTIYIFILGNLFIYYILWICYYAGIVNLFIFLLMAIIPVLYFVFVEILLKNYIAIIPTIIFGILHTFITYSNYKVV